MFNENHYVPILKWKRGEQKALEFLASECKYNLTPIIEIVPVPYDYVNDSPAKTIDDHLSNTVDQIKKSWGEDRRIFLDLYWLDESEIMKDGKHPLNYLMEGGRSNNLRIIPVTGPGRDSSYQNEVRNVNKTAGHGVCIRLEDEDFFDIDTVIAELLNDLDVNPEIVDLVIDLKNISPRENKKNAVSAMSVINSMPHANEWRTLTLCSSTFPENLSSVQSDNIGYIERSEWLIWNMLYEHREKLKRMPTFGDYAIANPLYNEIDPRFMQMSANIRYTINQEYLVFKGRLIKRHGWEQIFNLCKKVIRHPQYCGKDFSWGDNHIYECANEECTTGNSETWRRVGTNHHLTFVVNQISSLFSV